MSKDEMRAAFTQCVQPGARLRARMPEFRWPEIVAKPGLPDEHDALNDVPDEFFDELAWDEPQDDPPQADPMSNT